MGLFGKGYKAAFEKSVIRFIKSLFPSGFIYNAPRSVLPVSEWLIKNPGKGSMKVIYNSQHINESAPEIYNYRVSQRFTRYYKRITLPGYVAEIINGRVYGKYTNIILLNENVVAEDLTREFGAYGGVRSRDIALITRTLRLFSPKRINGAVAVISTSGADNFHHWLYDCLPRIHLLKASGLFQKIDKFLISMAGHAFQTESLKLLEIDSSRLINPQKENGIHYQAETLIVPSLPSVLGTVSPWVVDFLSKTFQKKESSNSELRRIYISRKKAVSRKIINNDAFLDLLTSFGVREIFPEDFTVSDFSSVISNAEFIISIHGSGLSNLCFASRGAVVVDILAPYHQDAYYWMITNIRQGRYIGFFADGEHPNDDVDLVRNKKDDDLNVDIRKLSALLTRELIKESHMTH